MNKIDNTTMKNLFSLFAFLLFSATFTFAQTKKVVETTTPAAIEEAAPKGGAIMELESTEVDYGTIEQHSDPLRIFNFVNTGTEPLVIKHAKGSCGCTVPKWPKEPIPPGEDGEIIVEFNSKNKKGKRNQKVTITANTNPPQSFIYLKGEVNPSAESTTSAPAQ